MKAYGSDKRLPIDNPDSIFEFEVPKPTALGHDILVRVEAISVNPVDVYDRGSNIKKGAGPKVIGWDAFGVVDAIGADVTLFQPGDKVYYAGAYDRPGTNSDFQLVDERLVGNAPTTLSPAEIAAMPLTALTAWESLFEQLAIEPSDHAKNVGKTILIIKGAGGVGSIATQLAHLAGLTVIATASRDASIAWTLAHGADQTVNHRHDLVKQVRELGYHEVDYILELNDLTRHWHEITELIKPDGQIVSTTGSTTPVKLIDLKSKRAKFAWEWMYTKSFYHTATMITQHDILNRVAQLLDSGQLKSTLNTTLSPISAQNLRRAHQIVGSKHAIGKVVITDLI